MLRYRQTVLQIITIILSAVCVLAAHFYIVDNGTVFKGTMEGKTIKAEVLRVNHIIKSNPGEDNAGEFLTVEFSARALNSDIRGKTVNVIQEIDKSYAFSPKEVKQGDKILIEAYTERGVTSYYFGDYVRITPLIFLGVIFCLLIIAFSGTQGLRTITSLGITCLFVFTVLLPAILNGKNIYLWTLIGCVFITASTLAVIGGYSKKTLCAFTGCISGVLCAGLTTVITDKFLNLTGMLEEESVYLYQLYPDNPINLKAIIFAMITVGALGAVMDVAMSISSSLFELKEKSPSIKQSELMKSGFTIGRDMMGTMANTLVLAYIGSSLTCVLLLVAYNANIQQVINKEIIISDILQALAGSMGMLLTLPLTSAVCSVIYNRRNNNVSDKNEPSA